MDRRGRAVLARWNGRSWSTVPLPAVPALHRGQISELVDVAVDEPGRVAAVGKWTYGTFPVGPLGHTRVATVVREPGTARLWAAVTDSTEREEPPNQGSGIWLGG